MNVNDSPIMSLAINTMAKKWIARGYSEDFTQGKPKYQPSHTITEAWDFKSFFIRRKVVAARVAHLPSTGQERPGNKNVSNAKIRL